MPKSTPVIFKRTLIAVAVLSISACSSMPQVPSIDLGGVGDGIVKAGKATASVSRKTWNATTYLLGFTDSKDGSETASPSDEQLLIADGDVNQVLPLADAPIVESDIQLSGIDNPVLVEQATASTPDALKPAETAILASNGSVEEDLIHEVASTETLWDIAKLTTGDATNWHILADVNNLSQNAAVFPGQQLIIPSNMVKPDYDTPITAAESATAVDANESEQEQLAESSRLAIPADSNETTEQLAQSANDAAQQIEDKAAQLAAVSQNATSFDLNADETLWDFAKRTTGDALNWQAIADQNNFSEKQAVSVRPGQTIFVPQSLLPADANVTTSAIIAPAPADDVVIQLEEPVTVAAEATSEEIIAPAAATVEQTMAAALPAVSDVQNQAVEITEELVGEPSILDETQPIQIVEATYKVDETLTPASTEIAPVQIIENENIPANIMVSGTYYPKAVYNNADFSSSLLMRVSPGTTLQVSRAMGTWFEVETEKGVGYVHQRDIK